MTIPSVNHLTMGIIGGGQLGRMLAQAAIDLHLPLHILDPSPQAPCKTLAQRFVQGDLTDFETVYSFGKTCDILTIEIENVNTEALLSLVQEGKKVYPQPHIIQLIQDKRTQKQFYKAQNIPTADFLCIEKKEEIPLSFLPAVQKLGKAGYDGRGVQVLKTPSDLAQAWDVPSVVEKYIPIAKELAVIIARNTAGAIKTFPVVEQVFHPGYHLLAHLLAPAPISPSIAQAATDLAIDLIQKLDMIGLLAVEFFYTPEGTLLVNEIAPRPHNSGHHTIEANVTSQFEQHLRAILDLPLGSTQPTSNAALVNLLGAPHYTGPTMYQGLDKILALEGVKLHLYGKEHTKPGRKMGHVTILDADNSRLQEKIDFITQHLKVIACTTH